MPEHKSKTIRGSAIIPIVLLLAILIPPAYSVVSRVFDGANETEAIFLEMPDSKHEECVKETEYMRYHHWELLRAIREEVVRYGVRGGISLSGCKNCHASREKFCNRCHDAASVKPDCYGCHYYP